MADRGGGGSRRPDPRGRGGASGSRSSLSVRPLGDGAFELVHPPCVEERWPDYEEGLEIWGEGEIEEARDALRYALERCTDNLWVHVALGRIALESGRDAPLARGHFGYVVELVERALPPGFRGRLPRDRPFNQPFFDGVAGLAACHEAEGRRGEAIAVRDWAARLAGDPAGRGPDRESTGFVSDPS